MMLDKRWKFMAYCALLFSALMALIVASTTVHGFPGNENITSVSVNDTRIGQSDAITWTMPILNNATNWLNITVTYNSTSYGPYNVTITPAGNAVINHVAPATYGNYTVYFVSGGAIQNATYIGLLVDHYLINLDTAFTETEAGFNALILATGESALDGHSVSLNDTLNVAGVGAMTWTTKTNNFYDQVTSAIPATTTYNTITSFLEDTYGITSAEINTTVTITWTTGSLDNLQNNLLTGDWIGAVIAENTNTMGGMFTYSVLMAILSIGIYNVAGPYATLFSWIMGWGTWSGVTHGSAQLLGVFFITLGLALAIVKVALDQRRS